jgi:hypothetical protein
MSLHNKLQYSFTEDHFIDDKNKLIASFFSIKFVIWIDSETNYNKNGNKIFKKLQKNLFLKKDDCFVFFDIQKDFVNSGPYISLEDLKKKEEKESKKKWVGKRNFSVV